jgi:hypothetical protein
MWDEASRTCLEGFVCVNVSFESTRWIAEIIYLILT